MERVTDNITALIAEAREHANAPMLGKSQWRELDKAIGLLRRLADALEAAVKEMHARELHHFEEEQKSARYRAAIEKAISWNTHDAHEPKFWDLHHILTRALNENGETDDQH